MNFGQEPLRVLMRKQMTDRAELEAARAHFNVSHLRTDCAAGDLVIPRYSALPYMNELEGDIRNLGCRLINSYEQHLYVANMDWYEDLRERTFPTWFRLQDVPASMRGQPLVLKGRTNSRKMDWKTHMFAENFRAASEMSCELAKDPFIGPQGIVARQYVPLETFETTLSGLPVTNEWRLFFYKGILLAWGYYWGLAEDLSAAERARPDFEAHGLPFAQEVALHIAHRIPFVVVDVAKTQDGRWLVVELNDGCQAGLNDTVSADELYRNLKHWLVTEREALGPHV